MMMTDYNHRRGNMYEIFTFQYEFLIENHLIKISIFGISSFLSGNCNSNPICDDDNNDNDTLLLPIGENAKMFPYYIFIFFFLLSSVPLKHAAVYLIIPFHKQYGWCISSVN